MKLDRNNVSPIYQIFQIRLLVNDFGLSVLKYDAWNAEFPLCECGEYDANEHPIFYCLSIKWRAFKNVLIKEEMLSSLESLVNCINDSVITALIDLLRVNESILDSCDTS